MIDSIKFHCDFEDNQIDDGNEILVPNGEEILHEVIKLFSKKDFEVNIDPSFDEHGWEVVLTNNICSVWVGVVDLKEEVVLSINEQRSFKDKLIRKPSNQASIVKFVYEELVKDVRIYGLSII